MLFSLIFLYLDAIIAYKKIQTENESLRERLQTALNSVRLVERFVLLIVLQIYLPGCLCFITQNSLCNLEVLNLLGFSTTF